MTVSFTTPSGITLHGMECQSLLEKVRFGGSGYWRTGSFTGELRHVETDNALILIVEPEVGVYVRYCPGSGEDEYALFDPAVTDSGVVVLYPGAEPMEVPRAQLVGDALCADIVAKFWAGGKRPDARWVVVGIE